MKFFLILLVIFNTVATGCSLKKRYPYKKIDYKEFAEAIFSNYNYEINYMVEKKYNDTVSLEITKANMSSSEYEKKVKSKLIDAGWYYMTVSSQGRDIYCLNESTQLSIFDSNQSSGTDEEKWNITIYYSATGMGKCEKLIKPFEH